MPDSTQGPEVTKVSANCESRPGLHLKMENVSLAKDGIFVFRKCLPGRRRVSWGERVPRALGNREDAIA